MRNNSPFLKLFRTLDRVFLAILDNISGLLIAVMFVIVLAAVVFRYILHASMGGIDEFNYYFMTLVIWVGASVTARNFENGHISVDLVGPFLKNKNITKWTGFFWQIVSIATIVLITKLSWEYTFLNKSMGFSMSGVLFPMWIFYLFMSIFSTFTMIYEIAKLVHIVRQFVLPMFMRKDVPNSAGSDREVN